MTEQEKQKLNEISYPKHKHPHRVDDTQPNEFRIWVCDECYHFFTDNEIREDILKGWGHTCKLHPHRKGQRCESHLEPCMPDINAIEKLIDTQEG